MYYVYVLRNQESRRFYTGYTSDLRKRLAEHNSKEMGYTRHSGNYNLIYYEACLDRLDARTREKYLKTGMGKRYLKNRIKRFLALMG